MIPLRDENPTTRTPVVTILVILACIGIYFFVQPDPFEDTVDDLRFNTRHAAIPQEIRDGEPLTVGDVLDAYGDPRVVVYVCEDNVVRNPCEEGKNVYFAVITSIFLHGSVLHLAGNLLFLWVFGNNVEDRLGPIPFAIFFLLAGIVATLGHVLADPASDVPVVGASGAIAGVMGAYLVWWPHARVRTLVFMLLVFFVEIPAAVLLVVWFVLQFFTSPDAGVAWIAHVVGFVFGVAVGLLLKPRRPARAAYRFPFGHPYR